MGEWLIKALLVGFVAWLVYHLLRPRYAFEIRIAGGRECSTSTSIVFFRIGCEAGSIALCIELPYLPVTSLRVIGLLLPVLLAGSIVWALWARRTPLIVAPPGRVAFRDRELCPAGT